MIDWDMVRWICTSVIAAGALVLGIRAEIRTSRYRPLWTIHDKQGSVTVINRTGEDARSVAASRYPSGGAHLLQRDIVADGESVQFEYEQSGIETVAIHWERPASGVSYWQIDRREDPRKFRGRMQDGFSAFRKEFAKDSPMGRRRTI